MLKSICKVKKKNLLHENCKNAKKLSFQNGIFEYKEKNQSFVDKTWLFPFLFYEDPDLLVKWRAKERLCECLCFCVSVCVRASLCVAFLCVCECFMCVFVFGYAWVSFGLSVGVFFSVCMCVPVSVFECACESVSVCVIGDCVD